MSKFELSRDFQILTEVNKEEDDPEQQFKRRFSVVFALESQIRLIRQKMQIFYDLAAQERAKWFPNRKKLINFDEMVDYYGGEISERLVIVAEIRKCQKPFDEIVQELENLDILKIS